MREGRRFILGFLLLVTLALLGLSNIPLAYADAVEESSGGAEADVDATGDVQVEKPEPPKEDEDDSAIAAAEAAAKEAADEAAARQAEAETAAAKAAAEAEASAVVDEVEEAKGDAFVSDVAASAKSKAMSFVDKAKEITPEQMKKVAAGALGIWGVAAGAGWVMNNLGGADNEIK
mmetsp:Transcript_19485/g.35274  ORF Transcript_19485/g.35274 Transcript_19485/m.35274 type:complete len:176 (+) Transcript_19485:122-649(+)|eukprot:CAMPEP_0201884256 /NCGR_PEP_ID=MMETSP0902-20130614/16810_1 /ASSEMBLY_ACC=CAM_ASM_000551 /TAXON_ID=420261 /ORGANISM="Thalassiosira antarctica, Strain CCMP982" /LENGTH=175 /DNA_ID=CAMNT_0048413179 /DNA_START=52 /DNA_END=579 /DNA_ORIENTATION=+